MLLKKMNCLPVLLLLFYSITNLFVDVKSGLSVLCVGITNNKTPTTRINAAAAATNTQRSKGTLEEGEVSPEVNRNDNEI